MSQLRKRECSLPPAFVLCRLSTDWMMPAHIGEGRFSLLSLLIQMLISSLYSLLIQMLISSRNNILPAIWAFLSPVKLTHKINHHMSGEHRALKNH